MSKSGEEATSATADDGGARSCRRRRRRRRPRTPNTSKTPPPSERKMSTRTCTRCSKCVQSERSRRRGSEPKTKLAPFSCSNRERIGNVDDDWNIHSTRRRRFVIDRARILVREVFNPIGEIRRSSSTACRGGSVDGRRGEGALRRQREVGKNAYELNDYSEKKEKLTLDQYLTMKVGRFPSALRGLVERHLERKRRRVRIGRVRCL